MISAVFLVSLLSVACADVTDVPHYVESIESIAAITKQLQDEIMSMEFDMPNITDPRRHYAILISHLGIVAQHLKNYVGSTYNKAYISVMPESIVLGVKRVDWVIDITRRILEKIDDHTQKLQDLIDALCTSKTRIDVCDQIVDEAVKGDPVRYGAEAELMLLAGKVADELLEVNLVAVAEQYDEVAYLLNHKDELSTLVNGLAGLIDTEIPPI